MNDPEPTPDDLLVSAVLDGVASPEDVARVAGDPALAAPLPAPPSLDLDSPNTVQTMASPLTIAAQGSTLDFFHCISIDPQHGDDVFLDRPHWPAGGRRAGSGAVLAGKAEPGRREDHR